MNSFAYNCDHRTNCLLLFSSFAFRILNIKRKLQSVHVGHSHVKFNLYFVLQTNGSEVYED